MLPRIPFLFDNGETLTPLKLSANFKRIKSDIKNLLDRRYTYSSFMLNFDGITSASNVRERTFTINPPRGFEIIGIEVELYSASGATATITCSSSQFESVTVDSLGATTRAYKYKKQSVIASASADISFIAAISAGTATGLKVVVHIRASRFSSEPTYFSFSEFKSGDTPTASVLNTLFSLAKTIVDNSDANTSDLRIQVFSRRSIATAIPTTIAKSKIPDSGKKLTKTNVVVVGTTGDTLTGTIVNRSGTTILAVTANAVTGSIVLNSGTVSSTQPSNTPDVTSEDWEARFSRTGGSVFALGYIVAFWE